MSIKTNVIYRKNICEIKINGIIIISMIQFCSKDKIEDFLDNNSDTSELLLQIYHMISSAKIKSANLLIEDLKSKLINIEKGDNNV
jgi:hypothetical protein